MKFRNYQRGELAKEILYMISVGVMIPAALIFPNLPIALNPLLKYLSKKAQVRPYCFVRSLTYLKKERLVRVKIKNNQQILILSEHGKRRILQYNLEKMEIKKPKKWDGFWRVIIFDVPERKKDAREALRNKLQNLGFYQLQKSCFVHPYECKKEIDFVTEIFRVSQHVNMIVAKSIEGEEYLKRFFDL